MSDGRVNNLVESLPVWSSYLAWAPPRNASVGVCNVLLSMKSSSGSSGMLAQDDAAERCVRDVKEVR